MHALKTKEVALQREFQARLADESAVNCRKNARELAAAFHRTVPKAAKARPSVPLFSSVATSKSPPVFTIDDCNSYATSCASYATSYARSEPPSEKVKIEEDLCVGREETQHPL